MEVFERHNEAVRRRVPPERLLVFDVREGWEPLCNFLGVEMPDGPFPRLNEAREMRRRLLGLVALSAVGPALVVLTGLGVAVFLFRRVGGEGSRLLTHLKFTLRRPL
jgi:Sulfotransferase domain